MQLDSVQGGVADEVGYTTPSTGRRKGLQKVFADEIADEARGPWRKMNRQEPTRLAGGIWHSYDSVKVFGTVFGTSEAKK